MADRLMTVGGFSVETRIPAPTIRYWVRNGFLPFQRDTAGRYLFDNEAVAVALKRRAASLHVRRGVAA